MTRDYTPYGKLNLMTHIDSLDFPLALEVMREHSLSFEELREWRQLYDEYGIEGLKTTKRIRR